jgi:nucleoid-associated protein YgaU
MEVEILKEALDLARVKKPTLRSRSQAPETDRRDPQSGTFQPGRASGWQTSEAGSLDPRRRCRAHDRYQAPVDGRPAYGYRRILKRERRAVGRDPIKAKRVYRHFRSREFRPD